MSSTVGGVVALGIDVGSTNLKAVLIAIEDPAREIAVCTVPTPNDAGELVRAAFEVIRSVLVAGAVQPDVVGIASMAETGVPLDRGGAPLSSMLRWDGGIERRDMAELLAQFPAGELFARTGVPATPKAPLFTWAKLRRTQPELFAGMRWSGAADLVAFALTGVLATDHTLAGRTMAYPLAFGGAPPGEYDADILAMLGMSAAQLPAVRQPGEPVGRVRADVGGRTGLVAGVPVHIAGHDHAVGAWAAGVRSAGQTADSLGTAEALIRILRAPPAPAALASTGISVTRSVRGEPALLAGSASAGKLVKWWFQHRIGAREPAELLAELAAQSAEPTALIVLPYLAGRQCPLPDSRATVRVLNASGDDVQMSDIPASISAKAMFEGLVLQLRWMLSELDSAAGAPGIGPMALLGGPGAANRIWQRVKSAVLPVPLTMVSAAEPVAAGAALLAAERAGLIAGEAAVLPATPVPAERLLDADPYSAKYRLFVELASRAPAQPIPPPP